MHTMTADEAGENLRTVRSNIHDSAEAAGRDADGVNLIAVSKKQSDDRVDAAIKAGQRIFGENRVQEATLRWGPRRQNWENLELHLVGPLQSNKAKDAVALFDVIHTVDRRKIAETLAREFDRQNRQLNCFIEINTGEEEAKAGVSPGQADKFIAECRDTFGLPIIGLMCIPPSSDEAALHFALLRDIAARNGLRRLSMGMSADYEKAIRFGATDIRVGTSIFGQRVTS